MEDLKGWNREGGKLIHVCINFIILVDSVILEPSKKLNNLP